MGLVTCLEGAVSKYHDLEKNGYSDGSYPYISVQRDVDGSWDVKVSDDSFDIHMAEFCEGDDALDVIRDVDDGNADEAADRIRSAWCEEWDTGYYELMARRREFNAVDVHQCELTVIKRVTVQAWDATSGFDQAADASGVKLTGKYLYNCRTVMLNGVFVAVLETTDDNVALVIYSDDKFFSAALVDANTFYVSPFGSPDTPNEAAQMMWIAKNCGLVAKDDDDFSDDDDDDDDDDFRR